jgi:hypothetical protein
VVAGRLDRIAGLQPVQDLADALRQSTTAQYVEMDTGHLVTDVTDVTDPLRQSTSVQYVQYVEMDTGHLAPFEQPLQVLYTIHYTLYTIYYILFNHNPMTYTLTHTLTPNPNP